MAQPPPPPQAWFPQIAQRSPTPALLVGIVVAVIILFGFFAFFVAATTGTFVPGIVPFVACLPVLFVIVIILVAIASTSSQRRIPPPPPIQQPMVPVGQQGPVALDCPNCGGPPTNVDRFGIATCSYCGTRFLVR